MIRRMGWIVPVALLLLTTGGPAWGEYRAYELEVINLYDCRINKREKCKSNRMLTAMTPDLYQRTHGGEYHVGVMLMATWMCRGDTSYYRPVCPRPAPNKPKFSAGEEVVVTLGKHISEGWRGRVEVAYYQASLRSNVYGVRFPDHRNVYSRYFEKDLKKAAAKGAQGAGSQ